MWYVYSQHLWIFKADERHSSNSKIMVVKHTGKILTISLNVDDLFVIKSLLNEKEMCIVLIIFLGLYPCCSVTKVCLTLCDPMD